jgi:anhydro-N-acetylmuramic acid kinase
LGSILAIGLMSGTSRDGIDAALIETDGENFVRPVAFESIPYQPQMRELLANACASALEKVAPETDPDIAEAELVFTNLNIGAVESLLRKAGVSRRDITAIGFHGHTLAHRPKLHWSWQMGDGARLAKFTEIDVVNDFRRADIALGGQGTPLAPIYHQAMTASLPTPKAVLNLGGVANITAIASDGTVTAFDCGMANALIDDWVFTKTGQNYDKNGALASAGTVDESILAALLDHPFFEASPPKSLDRSDFDFSPVDNLSTEDGAATLTAFSAHGVALGLSLLSERPASLLVAGGGRHNPALMAMIEDICEMPVAAVESAGWNGDATEAEAFAYMAIRRIKLLPISFPSTTGAPYPLEGGRLHRAPATE